MFSNSFNCLPETFLCFRTMIIIATMTAEMTNAVRSIPATTPAIIPVADDGCELSLSGCVID